MGKLDTNRELQNSPITRFDQNVVIPETAPIVPLGHNAGQYSFIAPSGQYRRMPAEALEAGRGVRALFRGNGPDIEEWCLSKFPAKGGGWCQKEAGLWIIEQCNEKGVFDPNRADMRSIGVWRREDDGAIAHCGDRLVYPDGQTVSLTDHDAKYVMLAASPISLPEVNCGPLGQFKDLFHRIEKQWGWQRPEDPLIWFGWVAAASLGGFPQWRAHLYVHGTRGTGKSKLIELAACLLGDLAGEVLNDVSEAGLRQSRNNEARPLLIDEFEPDDNLRNATRQDSTLGLLRIMSGGPGGRISRGSSDHSAVSFRILGAAYLSSINHIHLEPQDRSRFVLMELHALPDQENPTQAAKDLFELFAEAKKISARFRGKVFGQSPRWERTLAAVSARARLLGADNRQATTAATILAGFDLALFDGEIDELRLQDLDGALNILLADGRESDQCSESQEALDHLLSASLSLDHGIKRTVGELIHAEIKGENVDGVGDKTSALLRYGIHVDREKRQIAVRTGRSTPTAGLFEATKWRKGAHASALLKLEGATRPGAAVRFMRNQQHRVIQLPFTCLDE